MGTQEPAEAIQSLVRSAGLSASAISGGVGQVPEDWTRS